jgi:signal transduction histidine kinase
VGSGAADAGASSAMSGVQRGVAMAAWPRPSLGLELIVLGAAVLTLVVGWGFGVDALRPGIPADAVLKPNLAVSFLCASAGLWLVRLNRHGTNRRRVGVAAAAFAGLIGAATLVEHSTGVDLGIDQLVFDDPSAMSTPGRPGISASTSLVLCSLAIMLLDVRVRRIRPAQIAAVMMVIIAVGPLTGHLYSAPALTQRGSVYGMTFYSAAGVVLLAAAIIMARPRAGFMALPTAAGAGGTLARRLLAPVVTVPLVFGWLRLEGQRQGWYDTDTGSAFLVMAMIVVFGALVWRTATAVQAADADLRAAHADLSALNAVLEERVAKRTAQLEESNRELEAFSYSVSHDLRAPLRSVDGFSRIVLDEHAGHLDLEAKRYLRLVRESAQRMGELIDGLLGLSRIGRKSLTKQPVDTVQIVEEAIIDVRPQAGERSIDFRVGELPSCTADHALIRIVFQNLLGNAVKYTRGRDAAIVEVGAFSDPEGPVFYVRDNGVGFDQRYADRLFGAFQRLHRAEEYEGVGIGLATVHRIVSRHGGRVWAESAPDAGATFRFTLNGG